MPAQIATNGIILENTTVPFADFTRLIEKHLCCCLDTPEIELKGAELISADFAEQQLESFIRSVCRWGGYAGIGGRVLKNNSLAEISGGFRSAVAKLESGAPDISGALQEINLIWGLGTPSFASKHLRFLRPDLCPVLDSIISKRLDYSFDKHGYQAFSSDCAKIVALLQENQIENPRHRDGYQWYVGDIDMAIYAYLNNWIINGCNNGCSGDERKR
jgi:hypothetical protein